jgi:hypothetical protein
MFQSSSEEQQHGLNEINKIPKFYCTERLFFNIQTNSIERTYTYINDGLDYQIFIPKINDEHEIKKTLLNVRRALAKGQSLWGCREIFSREISKKKR